MRTVRVVPAYPVPDYGLRVLRALEDAGFETWVVGGWVRDALLGAPMHDVDVTTSAPWQETERVLRAAGIEVHETGTAHGTVTAVVEGMPVEVTTYRVEGTYSDRRIAGFSTSLAGEKTFRAGWCARWGIRTGVLRRTRCAFFVLCALPVVWGLRSSHARRQRLWRVPQSLTELRASAWVRRWTASLPPGASRGR